MDSNPEIYISQIGDMMLFPQETEIPSQTGPTMKYAPAVSRDTLTHYAMADFGKMARNDPQRFDQTLGIKDVREVYVTSLRHVVENAYTILRQGASTSELATRGYDTAMDLIDLFPVNYAVRDSQNPLRASLDQSLTAFARANPDQLQHARATMMEYANVAQRYANRLEQGFVSLPKI
ncbi:hypothetical protein HYV86_04875 [Candidatus Woesearchaeota archaeon]|nr:hypothetical protein [Candidatus Woesearchaeota archaeon]